MIAQLIWIMCIYASAAALVHLLHHQAQSRAAAGSGRKRLHYILITRNHEAVVEWYLRVLAIYALCTGRTLQVTVVDDGSEDGTMAVASRMAYHSSSIECAPVMPLPSLLGGSQLVDLRAPEPLLPLRIMQLPGSRGDRSKPGK